MSLQDFCFDMEEWRDIKGYEGVYQVSCFGRVRSMDRYLPASHGSKQLRKGQIIKGVVMPNGYLVVGLWNDNKCKQCYVHRLIAQAFIPNPNRLPQVNHKDEDKTNNDVSNLEWCDNAYNINYGTVKARISQSHYALEKGTRVGQYKDGKLIAEYINAQEASRVTGIDGSAIRKVCLGRPKFLTAGGYVWKEIIWEKETGHTRNWTSSV